jgi:flagellin-specific chaperone FliS
VIAASRAARAYRRVESESRSPLKFVVMLYDSMGEAWGHIATQAPAMAQAAGGR